jgi:hypothetical protein
MFCALLLIAVFQPALTFDQDRDVVRFGPFNAEVERADFQLMVYVASQCEVDDAAFPVLGEQFWQGARLVFQPEFGFDYDVDYCARVVRKGRVIDQLDHRYLYQGEAGTTLVAAVYPSSDTLPANHLRFYIQFSAPMQTGDAYDHFALLNENGEVVEEAFFQDRAELWDPYRQRFTLYLDPSRVKRGLRYREELGPVLETGQSYRLVIQRTWRDGNGQPLVANFEKAFRVGDPIFEKPDRNDWVIHRPRVGSREALVINFPRALDYGLLQHSIWLEDAAGEEIEGKVAIGDEERQWSFTPEHPWVTIPQIQVAQRLADSCGNSLAASFEKALD